MKTIVKEKTITLKCKNIDKCVTFYTYYTEQEPSEKDIKDANNEIMRWLNTYKKHIHNGKVYINVLEPTNQHITTFNDMSQKYETIIYFNFFICEV